MVVERTARTPRILIRRRFGIWDRPHLATASILHSGGNVVVVVEGDGATCRDLAMGRGRRFWWAALNYLVVCFGYFHPPGIDDANMDDGQLWAGYGDRIELVNKPTAMVDSPSFSPHSAPLPLPQGPLIPHFPYRARAFPRSHFTPLLQTHPSKANTASAEQVPDLCWPTEGREIAAWL